MTTPVASILWRRLDREGHEAARLEERDGFWHLSGAAVFAHEGQPCRLDYLIVCDASWKTASAKASGWLGQAPVELEFRVDSGRRWRANGVEQTQVAGCVDVDLNFSPSTNLLPIRRLGLPIGGEATVRAAWLRFPSFALEPLDQSYHRLGESTYRYESGGGRFVAELEVDARGFVTFYPGFAAAVR
jgi:uncharacterized protein